ncbi:hypothetical protein Bcoa_0844 [Heyndrickxia coagulans 36D1]|uniref:Uncharacterized protein n=1 Tax=Heyndrickxia coagulans 36D1 TaxID=345219 RepID=G2TQY6_HEYCO|nr:hypothetical protein Bcoa_0844 [Heyndrickxia coagulans 36D1]
MELEKMELTSEEFSNNIKLIDLFYKTLAKQPRKEGSS